MYITDKCDFCRCGEYNSFYAPTQIGWKEVAQAGVLGGHPDNTFSETFQAGKMYALTAETFGGITLFASDNVTANLPGGGTLTRGASSGGCIWIDKTEGVLQTDGTLIRPTNYASQNYGLEGTEFNASMTGACFGGFPIQTGAFSGVVAVWHGSAVKPDAASGLFGHWIPCADGNAISGSATFNCLMRIYEWQSPTRFYISNTLTRKLKGIRYNGRAYIGSGNYTELVEADHTFASAIEARTNLCTEYLRPAENVVIPWAMPVAGLLSGQTIGGSTDTDRRQTISPIYLDDTIGTEIPMESYFPTSWGGIVWPDPDCLCLRF